PEEGPAAHVVRSTTTGVYRYRGRFTLHVPVQVAAERVPPSVGALEAVDEHGCTLLTGSDSLDELALYVGLFGFRFTVHEPPELVAHIRDLAERLAASAAPERPPAGRAAPGAAPPGAARAGGRARRAPRGPGPRFGRPPAEPPRPAPVTAAGRAGPPPGRRRRARRRRTRPAPRGARAAPRRCSRRTRRRPARPR